MTFPCKDELIEFEHLERRQHRIYPDAADIGLFHDEFNVDAYRKLLIELMKVYGYKSTKWGDGKSVHIEIPTEKADDGRYFGIHLDVMNNLFHPGGKRQFITIYTRFAEVSADNKALKD